jgi:hypothetical protein
MSTVDKKREHQLRRTHAVGTRAAALRWFALEMER